MTCATRERRGRLAGGWLIIPAAAQEFWRSPAKNRLRTRSRSAPRTLAASPARLRCGPERGTRCSLPMARRSGPDPARADSHNAPTTHLRYDSRTRRLLEETSYEGRLVRLTRDDGDYLFRDFMNVHTLSSVRSASSRVVVSANMVNRSCATSIRSTRDFPEFHDVAVLLDADGVSALQGRR